MNLKRKQFKGRICPECGSSEVFYIFVSPVGYCYYCHGCGGRYDTVGEME